MSNHSLTLTLMIMIMTITKLTLMGQLLILMPLIPSLHQFTSNQHPNLNLSVMASTLIPNSLRLHQYSSSQHQHQFMFSLIHTITGTKFTLMVHMLIVMPLIPSLYLNPCLTLHLDLLFTTAMESLARSMSNQFTSHLPSLST